jgi:hypothetical protein
VHAHALARAHTQYKADTEHSLVGVNSLIGKLVPSEYTHVDATCTGNVCAQVRSLRLLYVCDIERNRSQVHEYAHMCL